MSSCQSGRDLLRSAFITSASGQFQVTVRDAPGNRVVIAASVDLAQWYPILTNTLESATWSFQSPIGPEPARYFRAEILAP